MADTADAVTLILGKSFDALMYEERLRRGGRQMIDLIWNSGCNTGSIQLSWCSKDDWLTGSAIHIIYTLPCLRLERLNMAFSLFCCVFSLSAFSLSLSPFFILVQLSFSQQHAI